MLQVSIDKDTISKLEGLALLKLNQGEKDALVDDLKDIIGMISTLQDVDTKGVEPLVNPNTQVNTVLRKDIKKNELDHKAALQNAKTKHEPYFSVPKVLK